jgi:hypothetical protein
MGTNDDGTAARSASPPQLPEAAAHNETPPAGALGAHLTNVRNPLTYISRGDRWYSQFTADLRRRNPARVSALNGRRIGRSAGWPTGWPSYPASAGPTPRDDTGDK